MRSGTLRPVHALSPPPEAAEWATARWKAWHVFVALTAAAVALVLVLGPGGEGRALHRLPPAERAALAHRTLDTLTSVCRGEQGRDLRALCRAQAQLALELPECEAACQATAREQLRTPTR
jgi:hypothetical protein